MKTPLARNSLLVALALSVLAMASTSFAKLAAAEQPMVRDLAYAVTDSRSLCLDLYQPSRPNGVSPLIIWIHGGAWRSGSKSDVPILGLLEHGFAIASVDYRLSPKAPFPAQVHDIQAAIRVLRARAAEYSLDPQRFYIAGASAGGHLAALPASNQFS